MEVVMKNMLILVCLFAFVGGVVAYACEDCTDKKEILPWPGTDERNLPPYH